MHQYEIPTHNIRYGRFECGLLGICGDMYSVPHVSDRYVRGPGVFLNLRNYKQKQRQQQQHGPL